MKLGLTLAAAAIALPGPASAQSWHDLVKSDRFDASVDMQSLRRDGPNVTYQALFRKIDTGSAEKRTVRATATINCQTHERTLVSSERRLHDGSTRSGSAAPNWSRIAPGSLTHKIEQLVCAAIP